MKRPFMLLMLLLLSLQSSWALAAKYCMHEEGLTSQHFGHHYHKHQQQPVDGKDNPGKSAFKLHADCSACHLSSPTVAGPVQFHFSTTLMSGTTAEPPHLLQSRIPDRPERPKWVPAA